jgi:hypothetical protein
VHPSTAILAEWGRGEIYVKNGGYNVVTQASRNDIDRINGIISKEGIACTLGVLLCL